MCESYSGPAKGDPIKRLTRLNSEPIKRSRLYIYIYTSALRLLALRGLRTLRVRRFTQWELGDIRETIRRFLVLY